MHDHSDLATTRMRRFLETEAVVWLSTVRDDGAPHLVPTWFTWDGASLTVLSKAGACKARNLAREPRAMLALGDVAADFDVAMVEATGEVLADATPSDLPPGFAAKYGDRIRDLGMDLAGFARSYPLVIRLRPVRALGWHGRTTPPSIQAAAADIARTRPVSIDEPRRSARVRVGEVIGPWTGRPLGVARPLGAALPASA